jgi:peptidyl-dipeptidase Dcp
MAETNPLLADWNTANDLPPFADIKSEQFRPAFDAALKAHKGEIEAIAAGKAELTFTAA